MKRAVWLILLMGTPLIVLCHFFVDIPLAQWAFEQSKSFRKTFKLIGIAAESHWWLVPSALLWFYWRKRQDERAKKAAFLFVAIAASGIAVNLLKILFGKARPVVLKNHEEFGFSGFNLSPDYASFPSGHTTTAFSIATALALLFPRYLLYFYMYAVVMAASRVLSWWHYSSDVVAGAMLGTLMTLALYQLKSFNFKPQQPSG